MKESSITSAVEYAKKTIQIVIAIIHYQDRYLLGYRSKEQHQGNLYEFIGGKIDKDEDVIQALIREVREESGIDISSNTAIKLGRLHHDYGDKQIDLQVYKVELNFDQYQRYEHLNLGMEGQLLTWVSLEHLLNNDYPLPAANKTILAWLELPALITVTHPLAYFYNDVDTELDLAATWLDYHQQHIKEESWTYCRLKASAINRQYTNDLSVKLICKLLSYRNDIAIIVPYHLQNSLQNCDQNNFESTCYDSKTCSTMINTNPSSKKHETKIAAYHLTHHELMTWADNYNQGSESANSANGLKDILLSSKGSVDNLDTPLVISCHDSASVLAANQLASLRLSLALAPVLAIFLSPVLATTTHPDAVTLGWHHWSSLAQAADMPVIALGGLSPSMQQEATLYGAISVAGITQFLNA